MIVWKHAYSRRLSKEVLIKLKIPPHTLLYMGSLSDQGKCRASQAFVLEICNKRGTKLPIKVAYSVIGDRDFKYQVGKVIEPKMPFDTCLTECTSGIHFYTTKELAVHHGGL